MRNKLLAGLLVLAMTTLAIGFVIAEAAPEKTPAVGITGDEIPESEWQLDVSFPDWKGDPSSTYAINNCVGFTGYSGQGKVYLECDKDVSGFDLFVNGKGIDVSAAEAGKQYSADISPLTVNGINTIQLSNLEKGTVRVCIPYPKITEGKPEETGIGEDALELIDSLITADIENGFSSAQLAVVKDGKLVYDKAWGNVRTYDEKGNPTESAPVTTDTLYDLASNTKMYSVNYAIQYLLTKGEIDLNSRVVDILGPEFADDTIKIDYEGYDAVPLETNKKWKEELTIRDLLRHQGGFPPGPHYYNDRYDHATQDFDSDAGNVIYVGTAGDLKAREETLEGLCKTPLMYEPGSQTIYSDADYMILCYCVEKLTGKRLDEYMSEVFFEPMGLKHITFNPLEHGFTKDDCAATELMGNTRDGNLHYSGIRTETIQGEVHDPNAYYCMAGISGHAGLFSNAADLAKLVSVMLTGGYGDKSYFSRDVIDLFTAPKSEAYPNYGLGWWREAYHRRDHYFGSVTES
ncbi:MAG: serine hydrolase, partial [Lachnospiraceae bacterium]|nr:serine hydrolase [Lachnospiraceae bacterium]